MFCKVACRCQRPQLSYSSYGSGPIGCSAFGVASAVALWVVRVWFRQLCHQNPQPFTKYNCSYNCTVAILWPKEWQNPGTQDGTFLCHVQGRLHGQFSNWRFFVLSMGFENECKIIKNLNWSICIWSRACAHGIPLSQTAKPVCGNGKHHGKHQKRAVAVQGAAVAALPCHIGTQACS